MGKKQDLQIKIPRGTIVKVIGLLRYPDHPAKLRKSLYYPMPENFLDESKSTILFVDDDPTNIPPLEDKE